MMLIQKSNDVLQQLLQLSKILPEGLYEQPLEILSGNSIGKHARHIIEFFECLIASAPAGSLDYDARKRDLLLETDRHELHTRINELASHLQNEQLFRQNDLILKTKINPETENVCINTSFDRELWYNIEHCIHHLAIMKIAARSAGVKDIPENFGVAFSTLAFQEQH